MTGENKHRASIHTFAAEAALVATAWIVLYALNGWMFANLEVTEHVSWIFIPAALRMFSVMVLNWSAVMGLFVGAMITNNPVLGENMIHALIGSTLTALGPYAATHLTIKLLSTANNFQGISPKQLYIFGITGSLCNVVPHCIWFWIDGAASPWPTQFTPMFMGDMIGTTIILYMASFAMKFVIKISH